MPTSACAASPRCAAPARSCASSRSPPSRPRSSATSSSPRRSPYRSSPIAWPSAAVTDIVVLFVAGDDGIKEQTIEAIRHAKAAQVPIIVAINKMDKADANADRVRQELLQHELVVEKLGGDILDVEVSATKKMNLEKLEEAILLQAEILDLKANPDRASEGVVIEAKLERGRGAVATVLIQRGTLRVGDIFVSGNEWGRVRAIIDERGANLKEAGPAMPVEVLGLNGAPLAGDDFAVDDMKAALSGMLSPTLRERFLGNAAIREVFAITKVGKVAGCMVTEGTVKRGAKVRLLRDNVVIHEGSLKTLKRFKDEVREVKEGYECGMAFENYQDIQAGDTIECFEVEEVARALA